MKIVEDSRQLGPTEPFFSFLGMVTVAKLRRYAILAAVTLNWLG